MDEINRQISANLKRLRKEKGLTLTDLSGICGVSKSMLGEIERGTTNPTILVLWKIAEGLKMPLTQLIQEEEKAWTIVRGTQGRQINTDPEFAIFSIFPYYAPHRLEIHRIEIPPGAALSNPGHMAGVEEYILVVSGGVSLTAGTLKTDLAVNDAVRFRADVAHEFTNSGDETTVLVNVMVYPDVS